MKLLLFLFLPILLFADSTKVKEIEDYQKILIKQYDVRKNELAQRDSVCRWIEKEFILADKKKKELTKEGSK